MKRTPLKRRTPLKKVSDKRRSDNMKYGRLRKAYLANHPRCEACLVLGHSGTMAATEIHHKNGRGKYLNDVKTWIAVDAMCHAEIHQFPNKSRELGLLV